MRKLQRQVTEIRVEREGSGKTRHEETRRHRGAGGGRQGIYRSHQRVGKGGDRGKSGGVGQRRTRVLGVENRQAGRLDLVVGGGREEGEGEAGGRVAGQGRRHDDAGRGETREEVGIAGRKTQAEASSECR